MAAVRSHVPERENELNDNLYNLKMSSSRCRDNDRSNENVGDDNDGGESAKKPSSVRRVRKMLKPLLRLLKKKSGKYAKRQRAEPRAETFTEDVDDQNNGNEALERRLLAGLRDAEDGAAITVCLDGQMTVVPIVPGQCYVPVHFAHTHAGDFYWTTLTLADSDLCYKERAFSLNQTPEMQVA